MLVSIGESLIDLVQEGRDDHGRPLFRAYEGGSPFNVAIAMARLGASVGFLCPTSTDALGVQLRAALSESGVAQLCGTPVDAPTALAVVSTDAEGHPSYSFHRAGTADRMLNAVALCEALPESLEALHFGSMVLAQGVDWPAWRAVVQQAREQGVPIALDPNIRLGLTDALPDLLQRLEEALQLSDLVKVSDEDLRLLYPSREPEGIARDWLMRFDLRCVIVTRGSQGATAWSPAASVCAPVPRLPGPVVDTVGAGDTFQGAALFWLARRGRLRSVLAEDELGAMLEFAIRAAGINCLRAGCQPPKLEEVESGSPLG